MVRAKSILRIARRGCELLNQALWHIEFRKGFPEPNISAIARDRSTVAAADFRHPIASLWSEQAEARSYEFQRGRSQNSTNSFRYPGRFII